MNRIDQLVSGILNYQAPTAWHVVERWEFEVRALSEAEYFRIRSAATRVDGRVDVYLFSIGMLDAVVGWRGVTLADFPGTHDPVAATEKIPFSRAVLDRFLENRSRLLTALVELIRAAHTEYAKQEADDQGN